MKRKLVIAEIVIAVALSCGLLAWISGAAPKWLGNLLARGQVSQPLGQYSIEILTWGVSGRVFDLSKNNLAAGVACDSEGRLFAAVWNGGETILFEEDDRAFLSEAVGLSADGTVAFNVLDGRTDDGRGFVKAPGAATVCLNDCIPGTLECRVRGINERGTAVGTIKTLEGEKHAFVWNARDGMQILEGATSVALDINDDGVVVGFERSRVAAGAPCAWIPTSGGYCQPINFGGALSIEGRAYAVNSTGLAVGRIHGSRPMRWDATGGLQVLPGIGDTYAGWAHDVNDAGDIVGCLTGFEGGIAVVWRDGKAYDLNRHIPQSDRWHLVEATAVNNAGVIACRGVFDDEVGMVLLHPRRSGTAEAPVTVRADGRSRTAGRSGT